MDNIRDYLFEIVYGDLAERGGMEAILFANGVECTLTLVVFQNRCRSTHSGEPCDFLGDDAVKPRDLAGARVYYNEEVTCERDLLQLLISQEGGVDGRPV